MQIGIDREGALVKAFEFIFKSETAGAYCEFGVFQGVSLARAVLADSRWRKKTGKTYIERFFGFDSFEGLPQFTTGDRLADYDVFQPGQFGNTSERTVLEHLASHNAPTERVTLIPGFYADSLQRPETLRLLGSLPVAIAHIDCDLYSSAAECLDFLTGRLADGAVVLFDDWFCYRGRPDRGVHKAFDEWLARTGYLASDYCHYSWAGKAFIVNTPDATD